MIGSRYGLAVLVGVVALSLQAGASGPVAAQDRTPPQLPDDCWSGEIVVATGGGRDFDCVPIREALKLSGCDSGDFVTVNSSGNLACEGPDQFGSSVRALLPDCSSGSTLVSEGFGRWSCHEADD